MCNHNMANKKEKKKGIWHAKKQKNALLRKI